MSARPLRSEELLRLAATLAGRDKGAGRPRTVELRRAVSTAYYALFHELCTHSVEHAYGRAEDDAHRRNAAARWVTHLDLRTLARTAATGSGATTAVLEPVADDLQRLATAFLDLQDARHDADYNHDYDIDKRAALSNVDLAEDTVRRARRLRDGDDPSYRRFLVLMLGGTRIARSR